MNFSFFFSVLFRPFTSEKGAEGEHTQAGEEEGTRTLCDFRNPERRKHKLEEKKS